MKHLKQLNEYGANAESEHYQEEGIEGVSAKDILLNTYPKTLEKVIEDFDAQCDESDEFKNKNLSMLRSLIVFFLKYHTAGPFIKSMEAKYNIK